MMLCKQVVLSEFIEIIRIFKRNRELKNKVIIYMQAFRKILAIPKVNLYCLIFL